MHLHFQRSLKMIVYPLPLLLGVLVLLGCLTSSVFAAPVVNAFVRVAHASPGAGNVDVFADGKTLLSNVPFGMVSGYTPLAAGSHKIQVAPAGKGIGSAVITQAVPVTAGSYYTVAALGTAATGFSLEGFADNNTVAPDKTKVRVYHLSPNAGPVNVATGGKTVITGLTYQKASDYLTVPAAAYKFEVTATQPNVMVPVSATLTAGTVNSIFAVGLYKGEPALKFVLATVKGLPLK